MFICKLSDCCYVNQSFLKVELSFTLLTARSSEEIKFLINKVRSERNVTRHTSQSKKEKKVLIFSTYIVAEELS